jgi:hypothetical protein
MALIIVIFPLSFKRTLEERGWGEVNFVIYCDT